MVKAEEMLDAVARSAAWSWMQRRYLQSGPVCQACSAPITGARAVAAWHELRKVYCASCGKESRPTVGTPIYGTSWQPEEYVQLLLLDQAGRTSAQIAAALGKSAACVRDMIDRIHLHHQIASAPPTDSQALTAQG